MEYPKVLVCAPNSIHKNYIANEYFSMLKNLSYPNYEIFIVDNSPEDANKELYESLGIKYKWVNPKGKSSFQFIWESQNEIRNYFLDGDFKFLVFIETDIIPPPWIIDSLLAHNKPVVGMPYFIYKDDNTLLMNQEIDPFWTGGETRNFSLEESFMQMNGDLKQAFSIGFGCILIERWVIAKYLFRYIPDEQVKNDITGASHADSFWFADLYMNGMDVYLDTSMVIPHYNLDWMKIKTNE